MIHIILNTRCSMREETAKSSPLLAATVNFFLTEFMEPWIKNRLGQAEASAPSQRRIVPPASQRIGLVHKGGLPSGTQQRLGDHQGRNGQRLPHGGECRKRRGLQLRGRRTGGRAAGKEKEGSRGGTVRQEERPGETLPLPPVLPGSPA